MSLILHIIILVLCVPLLAGISLRTEQTQDTFDVMIVVDLSDSQTTAVEEINERIQTMLNEEYVSDFRIGMVTFGADQLYVSEIGYDPDGVYDDYIHASEKPDASATDLGAALLYAADLLAEPTNSRLILLSDGLATDGDALPVVRALAAEGIRLHGVYIEPDTVAEEVQLGLLEVEREVSVGEPVAITVDVQSTAECLARLTLYDNGVRHSETTVTLAGGAEQVKLAYEPAEGGLHELCVSVESERDTASENNIAYAYAYLDVSEKLLIVDGTGRESEKLKEFLAEDYHVTVVSSEEVPKSLHELGMYAEVILMNVDAADLPSGFDDILNTYVYEQGGGLFTVGGKKTYALGHMAGTKFDDMLPIRISSDEEQVLELVLIMDISASMSHIAEGSDRPKVEIAKEGAIACVKTLKDADFVGLVTFDKSAEVFQSIAPATQRDQIIQKINGIETGVGTYYSNALNMARTMLFHSTSKADKQHVIFLTDGAPSDMGYTEIIRSMVSRGITVSAIAVCSEGDQTVAKVEEIADVGNGRSYVVADVSMLPDIMRKETELSQRELINEETVTPQYKDYSPVMQGIAKLPTLDGYIGAGAKPDAQVVYTVGSDPIYAEWSYGKGKVGSFMSDLSGQWSKNFWEKENGRQFLRNVVRYLDRHSDDEETGNTVIGHMDVEFQNRNRTTEIHVKKKTEAGCTVEARITAPDGTVRTMGLYTMGENGYMGSFETVIAGLYRVYLEERDEKGNVVSAAEAFTTFSYSREYDVFADPLDGYMHLYDLCSAGGGRIWLSDEPIFERESLVIVKDHDPSLPLLIVILLLFLADIAVRKFHLKWPHKIIRTTSEKRE